MFHIECDDWVRLALTKIEIVPNVKKTVCVTPIEVMGGFLFGRKQVDSEATLFAQGISLHGEAYVRPAARQ